MAITSATVFLTNGYGIESFNFEPAENPTGNDVSHISSDGGVLTISFGNGTRRVFVGLPYQYEDGVARS